VQCFSQSFADIKILLSETLRITQRKSASKTSNGLVTRSELETISLIVVFLDFDKDPGVLRELFNLICF